MDVIGQVTRPVVQAQHPGHSGHMFGVGCEEVVPQSMIFPMVVQTILECIDSV